MMNLARKVGCTSLSYSNGKVRNEEVHIWTVQEYFPRLDNFTLYLPNNLDIDQILEENPPKFKFKRDKFVYILSLIYSIPAQKKDKIENYSGFTPISKSILGSVIKDYKQYIGHLKELNIVEEDSHYIVGEKSRGLRFTEVYRKPVKPVTITDWCLIKNIVYLRKNIDKTKTQELHYLRKWFLDGKLNVNIDAARTYLTDEWKKDLENPEILHPDIRLNSRILPIERLNSKSKNPLFFVDKTAGRLHTNFTQLKSELRKYVSYDGKILCSVDISNSQPYLLNSLLSKELYERNDMKDRIRRTNLTLRNADIIKLDSLIDSISQKEDVILFRELINSGQFYEKFGEVLHSRGIIDSNFLREKAKEITFCTIFNKNNAIKYVEAIQIFENLFPNVYKVIKSVKKGHHPTLAIILQNLEAELILHKTCKVISEEHPEIPLFTLHDSIITTEENKDIVQAKMIEILSQNLNYEPNLKVEEWK